MVQNFLNHGHLLKDLNRTFITLIPKKENPKKVNDYRPISQCNTSYQIISKLLANRLRIILLKIISSLGSTFVSNKDIHDK